MSAVLKIVFRVVMALAGLIFLASLLAAALVVLGVWLLRGLWARLTGQPVKPWAFQFNRQAVWDRFYRQPGQGQSPFRGDPNVIDVVDVNEVKPREIQPPQP
jgi:hypothetical protein